MEDMGNRLKQERETSGLSQKQLADVFMIKQNTISQYEKGVKRPSYEVLVMYAKYFKISTDYLLGLEE